MTRLAGSSRVRGGLAVGPGPNGVQALDGRHGGVGAHGEDDVPGADGVLRVFVGDGDEPMSSDTPGPPDDHRTSPFEPAHVAGVTGIVGALAADHVVTPGRRPRPVVGATGCVHGRRMQQRLGGHAGPERAGATVEVPVDDRDGGAALAGQVGRGFAGRAGADDGEVERRVHVRRVPVWCVRQRPVGWQMRVTHPKGVRASLPRGRRCIEPEVSPPVCDPHRGPVPQETTIEDTRQHQRQAPGGHCGPRR